MVSMVETIMRTRYGDYHEDKKGKKKLRQYIVKSVVCDEQDINGCAIHVVGQAILYILDLQDHYKMDRVFERSLRDWMFHYAMRYKVQPKKVQNVE